MKHSHHKLRGVMSMLLVLALFFTAMPSGALAVEGAPDTEPVTEPVVAPTPEAEPVTEPVVAPTPEAEPVTAPVVTPTPEAEPVTEPVVTPTPEAEPVTEPVVTPEPKAEPTEPVVPPTPDTEPVTEPVVTPEPKAEPTEPAVEPKSDEAAGEQTANPDDSEYPPVVGSDAVSDVPTQTDTPTDSASDEDTAGDDDVKDDDPEDLSGADTSDEEKADEDADDASEEDENAQDDLSATAEEVETFLAEVKKLTENLPEDEESYAAVVEQVKALYEALSEDAKADSKVQELYATLCAATLVNDPEKFDVEQYKNKEGVYVLEPSNVRKAIYLLTGSQTINMHGANFSLGADNPIEIPSGLSLTLTNASLWRQAGYNNPLFFVRDGASLTIVNGSVTDQAQNASTPLVQTEGSGTFTLGEGATSDIVAKNANGYYSTLAAAVANAGNAGMVTLEKDIVLNAPVNVAVDVCVDLAGHSIQASEIAFQVGSGVLTLRSGAIHAQKNAIEVLSGTLNIEAGTTVDSTALSGVHAVGGTVNVASGATVETKARGGAGIVAMAAGNMQTTVNVYGTVLSTNEGGGYGLCGNAANKNTGNCFFNIYPGAVIRSEMTCGVFLPNPNDTTTITGGTISGPTGIEIRGGVLDISGNTAIEGFWDFGTNPNVPVGNGNSAFGAGIVVSRHIGTAGGAQGQVDVTVRVASASVSAPKGYAVFEKNLVDSNPNAKIDIQLMGGSFSGGLGAVRSDEDAKNITVTGGSFSSDVSEYCHGSFDGSILREDGRYHYVEELFVAQIGDTLYHTVKEAFDAAGDGATIVLLENVTECVTVKSGKNVTLDLNGKTLTNVEGDKNHTITVNAGGILTVNGPGTVDNVSHQASAVFNDGTVYLNSGTFNRSKENGVTNENSGGNSFYTISNRGTMVIGDGVNDADDLKIMQNGAFSSLVDNGTQNRFATADTTIAELTINGGYFDHGKITLKNEAYGRMIVNDGIFVGSNWIVCNYGEAKINGGEFNGKDTRSGIIYNAVDTLEESTWAVSGKKDTQLKITGGRFTFNATSAEEEKYIIKDYAPKGTWITGGSYSNLNFYWDVDAKRGLTYSIIPYSFNRFRQSDGTYTIRAVTEEEAAARIDGTFYPTLANAVKDAAAGNEVVLLKNITQSAILWVNKGLTLNLNSKTVTLKGTGTIIANSDKLTITGNGTVINRDSANVSLHAMGGDLIIENGTFITEPTESKRATNSGTILVAVHPNHQALIKDGKFMSNGTGTFAVISAEGANAQVTMLKGSVEAKNSYINEKGLTTGPNAFGALGGGSIILGEKSTGTGPVADSFAGAVGMNNLNATGTLTIYGGTYTTHNTYQMDGVAGAEKFNSLLYLSATGATNIYGGTFRTTNPTEAAHLISLPYQNIEHLVTIFGGNFESKGEVFYLGTETGSGNGTPKVSITGGTFSDDVDKFHDTTLCAQEYTTTQLPNGSYLVRSKKNITIIWEDGFSEEPVLNTRYDFESADNLPEGTYPAAPTREGYTFTGWSAPVPAENGSAIITAQWAATPMYTVRWENGYASGPIAEYVVDVEHPRADAQDPAAPTREGYAFTGWSESADADGNVTITAQWAKLISVTWQNGYDGTAVKTLTGVTGYTQADRPAVPTREGYTFTGWGSPVTDADGNVTIAAMWEKNDDPTPPVEPEDPDDPTPPVEPEDPDDPTPPVEPEDPTTPNPPVTPTTPTTPVPPAPTPAAPAAPAARTPAATIDDPDTPLAPPEEELDEPDTPLALPEEELDEPDTPLAPPEEELDEADTPLAGGSAWSLLNLILLFATVLVSLLLMAGVIGKKANRARMLGVLPAIASVVAFLLTERIGGQMVFVDRWTWLMALIALGQCCVAAASMLGRSEEDRSTRA